MDGGGREGWRNRGRKNVVSGRGRKGGKERNKRGGREEAGGRSE